MSIIPSNNEEELNSMRTRSYLFGAAGGVLLGLLSAYFYSRAVEDDIEVNPQGRRRVGTGEMISIGLAVLAMVRQIAELGRVDQPKK